MGIEPTEPAIYEGSNGFEDRGHHQVCKHFRSIVKAYLVFGCGCRAKLSRVRLRLSHGNRSGSKTSHLG